MFIAYHIVSAKALFAGCRLIGIRRYAITGETQTQTPGLYMRRLPIGLGRPEGARQGCAMGSGISCVRASPLDDELTRLILIRGV